ncbi:hypothetical protein Tco_0788722 [Tanacetum coccineum]
MICCSILPDIPRFSKGSVDPFIVFIHRRRQVELFWITSSQSPEASLLTIKILSLESLKKYGFDSCDPVDTPMVEKSKLDEDKEGKAVDPSHYRGYQARPTKKHLNAVKRIFQYLKGTIHRGLWYPKDSLIALIAFTDVGFMCCQDTRVAFLEVCNFWVIDLLAGRLKGRKALRYPVRKLNILLCLAVIQAYRHQISLYQGAFMFENGSDRLYLVIRKSTGRHLTKLLPKRISLLINKLGMRSFTPETLKQLADEVDE